MTYAIIGKGKTGGELLKLLPQSEIFAVFDSKNRVTEEKLFNAKAALVFVSGEVMVESMPSLIAAKVPAVIGVTGITWPQDLDAKLKQAGVAWIVATNFSLGMNLCFSISRMFARAAHDFPEMKFSISEAHHVHKKDSPSGTALTLERTLREEGIKDVPIDATREGDIRGVHTLKVSFPEEVVELRHEAMERSLFARGAIFAAENLLQKLSPGLYRFEDLMDQRFRNLRSS